MEAEGYSLNITEPAMKRLSELCQEGEYVRIIVSGGGCAGFQYSLMMDNMLQEEDLLFGGHVLVDETSASIVRGGTLDFISTIQSQHFELNSNAFKNKCGCGHSFGL